MSANMQELSQLSEIIDIIYQGATDPDRWVAILSSMAGYVASPQSQALLNTPRNYPDSGGFAFTHNMTAEAIEALFHPRFIGHNILADASAEQGFFDHSGNVMTCEDLLPRETFENSLLYQEYLSRYGYAYFMGSCVFGMDAQDLLLTTCSYLNRPQDGPFSAEQCQRQRLLMPHLSRALGVMLRLRDAEFKVAANRAALDLLNAGVLLIGPEGEVVFANRRALCVLRDEDGLRLRHRAGKRSVDALQTTDAHAQKEIDCALQSAITPDILTTPHFARSVSVPRPSQRVPYALNFSSLSIDNEFGAGSDTPRAIVFLTDAEKPLAIDTAWLRSTYGLTEAEMRAAMMLADGATTEEIASNLGVSINTVKTQLQQVYTKTGVNNRAKLVRLLLSLSQ